MKLTLFTLNGPTVELPRDPDRRVISTVAAMIGITTAAARDPRVVRVARQLLASEPVTTSRVSYPVAVYWYCRARVRFRKDPDGVELLQAPGDLIAQAARNVHALGDCDDRSMLGAALLIASGRAASIIVMSRTPGTPFEHVFYGHGHGIGGVRDIEPYDPQERFQPGKWPPPLPDGGRVAAFPVA